MSRWKERGITAARMLQQEHHRILILFEIFDFRRERLNSDEEPTKEDGITALVSR